MDKIDVQQRVLQYGKPISINDFNWCEKTNNFSSKLFNLIINFNQINNCTFDTLFNCTFKTGEDCNFKTGSGCTFDTGFNCTFDTGSDCIFKTGSDCTFDTGFECTFKTGSDCTFKTGSDCTFDTGFDCTFDTGFDCTFKTGEDCTFKTGFDCTFDTGSDCTFDTGSDCTFDTKSGCTFNTRSGCKIITLEKSVIVNRNVFEVITPNKGDIIQIFPYGIEGHLVNGLYKGIPHIIADGILSKIISQKGDIIKVINHGEEETSYIVKKENVYSHGKTLKEARDGLIYKIFNRDTSKYNNYTLETVVSHEDAIKMYNCITGSCFSGISYFVEQMQDKIKSEYTISELIELTKNQYGHKQFKKFLNEKNSNILFGF